MGKYKKNFFQVPNEPFSEESECVINKLSLPGFKLYIWLLQREHRFTGKKKEHFYSSNEDLARVTRISLASVKRAKAELKKYGLIKTWQAHWIDPKTRKKSRKRVTAFRILPGKREAQK